MPLKAMQRWWKLFASKWSGYIGDRDVELALRKFLNNRGFRGEGATFRDYRLAAVQRPGWLQVFVFTVETALQEEDIPGQQNQTLFGILRQDERYRKMDIEMFSIRSQRNALFREWSEELIALRRQP